VQQRHNVISLNFKKEYIYIGRERAILESGEYIDELKQCMEGRYISSHKTSWIIWDLILVTISQIHAQ
jgi:hypothetical protein